MKKRQAHKIISRTSNDPSAIFRYRKHTLATALSIVSGIQIPPDIVQVGVSLFYLVESGLINTDFITKSNMELAS